MDYGDKPAAAKWSLLTPPRWSLFAPPLTTQAALVRNLMDELDSTSNDAPDESTVRKKVSRLWKSGLGA